MKLNVTVEVAGLQQKTLAELRAQYAELFGEATQATNRVWLVRRIAWRLQALAEGGLSERARQRAAELANEADLRIGPPRAIKSQPVARSSGHTQPAQADPRLPRTGTILTRRYKKTTLQVLVLDQGFEFGGQVYSSLSAVAKAITGSHCNGFLFFGLAGKGARP